jgi:F0F1-type ATP synthase membrane subunit a
MLNYIFLSILFLLLNTENKPNVWQNFIEQPNEQNYEKCIKKLNINTIIDSIEYRSIIVNDLKSEGRIGKILSLTERGNIYAGHLCFHFFIVFKGHIDIVEELNISLGKMLKSNPKVFLTLLNIYLSNELIKYSNVRYILRNYGPDYVDDNEKKIDETNARINALKNV